jgi:O-acetyl-ADP-ribose deacetylase (regulator of RNase III)
VSIIHVAGIGFTWSASPKSVQLSVRNALTLARREGFQSLAMPLIGAGTGALEPALVLELMLEACSLSSFEGEIRIVCYAERR